MNTYSYKNLRILIVDDNPHMYSVLSAILSEFQCRTVFQATDPEQAYEQLANYKPDIVFADLIMRPTDGIEFVQRVRNDPDSPNPFLPIIMISGHASSERVGMARDVGVNEFLIKPVSANALVQRMDAVIQHPRPFVRAKTYFGPDRRRRKNARDFRGSERRDLGIFHIDDRPSQRAIGD